MSTLTRNMRVTCVDAQGHLSLRPGHEYVVTWVSTSGALVQLEGFSSGFRASRFEPTPVPTAPAAKVGKIRVGARWFVIDLTDESLVALRLENRGAGVQWIKSFGNLSHQYVVAKETGEFKVSREVAEV